MLAERAFSAAWSPDGKELMFAGHKNGSMDYEVRRLDIQTGMVSEIPGGQQKFVLAWSAEGRQVAKDEAASLWILDPQARKWNQLFQGPCATATPSPDGNYVYCETSNVPYHKVVRVRISSGHVETVMEIKGLRRVVDDEEGTLLSVALDGSVLLTRCGHGRDLRPRREVAVTSRDN